jgi:RNA 2',3'-cyclic 3'-phosphodiesterase
MSRHATARLFVAVDPPARVRDALSRWARGALRAVGARPGSSDRSAGRASGGAALRVLDPDALHVTLCFLGNQPVDQIEQIAEQLRSLSSPVCELSLGAPLWLPPRRPRVLAVELHEDTGELERLHRSLLSALLEACELPSERGHVGERRHRFRPHVTVARMRTGAAPRERTLAPTPSLSFTAQELVLYRSWLSEQGASYEPLDGVPLG